MLPKKKKNDLDIGPKRVGNEFLKYGEDRIKELLATADSKSTFLPKPIDFYDIDSAIREFVRDNDLKFILKGKDVPVIYLTNERWGEFSKSWTYTDEDKNIPTPFITVRRIARETGTRMGTKWNVPNGRLFKYLDVPVLDDGQEIFLRFKINQPIAVDMTYEIRLFSKQLKSVNNFDKLILKTFRSRQAYVFVKGNPMPIHLEEMGEDSTIDDINGDRMYVNTYTIKILAFILTEEDFKVVKTFRKPNIGYKFN